MNLKFWAPKPNSAGPSGECAHMWSNWSDPAAINVTSYSPFTAGATEREGWAQDRHCMKCNVYERRLA